MSRFALHAIAFVFALFTGKATPADPSADVNTLVKRFTDIASRTSGYEVVMTKELRILNRMRPAEVMLMKHARTPECRYLRWIGEEHTGREVIYCASRYYGRLQIHETGIPGGLFLTASLSDPLARNGNLRPITESGIYVFANMLTADLARRSTAGTAPLQISDRTIDDQLSLCRKSDSIEGPGSSAPYPIGATELCFDKQSAMPTEVSIWRQDGVLMEHYAYRQWNLMPSLSDRDFDTQNPQYGFK